MWLNNYYSSVNAYELRLRWWILHDSILKRFRTDVGSKAGTALKSTSGWGSLKGVSGNGTDAFGFSALPGHGDCSPV